MALYISKLCSLRNLVWCQKAPHIWLLHHLMHFLHCSVFREHLSVSSSRFSAISKSTDNRHPSTACRHWQLTYINTTILSCQHLLCCFLAIFVTSQWRLLNITICFGSMSTTFFIFFHPIHRQLVNAIVQYDNIMAPLIRQARYIKSGSWAKKS